MITSDAYSSNWGLVLAVALLASGCDSRPTRSPHAELVVDPLPISLQLTNLPAGVKLDQDQPWQLALRLHHVNSQGQLAPPVAGTYRVVGNRVEFEPAFPLLPGHDYTSQFDPSAIPALVGLTVPLEVHFRTAEDPQQRTTPRVVAIYPSGDLLPANHLKFYIDFSEPMVQGEIFGFFSLIDRTSGKPVARPFRHTELWSADELRLTLWFHPGRQKIGVNLNVELGAILTEGNRYELRIDPDWTSRKGVPLAEQVVKSFRAGPPDHQQPDPANWKLLHIPASASTEAFVCDMQEPLDWALAHRVIKIHGPLPLTAAIPGKVKITTNDRLWGFTPSQPWTAGRYQLSIGGILEDHAGNSVERPFEVDVSTDPVQKDDPDQIYSIDFTIPVGPGEK